MPQGCEPLTIASDVDIVRARQAVRAKATELGFGLVDQTKLVTAASELARNALDHGGGGVMRMEVAYDGGRRGLRLTFEDQGPGIPDPDLALTDGFTTGKGLGLGLGGARRLVDEFSLASGPGTGTTVAITRWQRHAGTNR
jgi:serine/threonine-protein kinase RsbT